VGTGAFKTRGTSKHDPRLCPNATSNFPDMKSSDINALLAEEIPSTTFKNLISEDVKTYSLLMNKKGTTIQLNFADDESIYLDKIKFVKLLQLVINNKISKIDLAYICDCLTLADNIDFDNEQIIDHIHDLADPEINGGYKSTHELLQIISALHGH
jgi:hypothetical protein